MNFTVRLTEALWRRLKIAAMNEKRSMRDLLIDALESYLKAKKAA